MHIYCALFARIKRERQEKKSTAVITCLFSINMTKKKISRI